MSIYCINFLVSKLFSHSFIHSFARLLCLSIEMKDWMKCTRPIKKQSPSGLRLFWWLHIQEERMTLISTTSAHFCPLIYLFLSDWDVIVCLVESSVFCSAAVYVYIFLSQRVPDIGPINSCHASFSPELWLIKILRWSSVAPFLSHVTSCIF